MDAKQLKQLVIGPTLKTIGLYSEAADQLILGTIFQESRAKYLKQLGSGPALGVIQMEPNTYNDIWDNYLKYKPELAAKITHLASVGSLGPDGRPDVNELVTNLAFAVGMCRVHYLRVKEKLPAADDVEALGRYWKQYYNTVLGAGTVDEFVAHFPKLT
ncbi:hypothetical protein RJY99_004476 [Vibrio vulnificus]|nr:hypothetical protein [Vibrio vulnificus]